MPIRTKKFRVQDGGGSPPPAFCSNFTSALLTSNWQTTNFDVPTQNFDLAQPVSQFTFLVAPSDQAWQATSGDVSFELETNSASGSPSAYGLSILDETQGINIAGFTYENNGDLRDVVSGSPISAGNTIQAGLNCGMRFTASTTGSQAAEVYDNAGNSVAVPLTVDPAYNPYNELKLVISCGTATTATLNFDLNFGTKAFVLPQSNGTYCNQVFVPPAVCTEIDLFLNRFGAAQTINITDNSVEAISTGNAGVTDVMTGTGSEARFTTSTDEVKFETTLDAVSSATNAANYQVGFFDFAQGLLVAGVSVTPNPGVGTLFDIVNGVPIANGS